MRVCVCVRVYAQVQILAPIGTGTWGVVWKGERSRVCVCVECVCNRMIDKHRSASCHAMPPLALTVCICIAFAVMYAGQWRGLQIALKTLTFEVSDMPAGTEGAHRASKQLCQHQAVMEAAVAASIDHANVVRTYRHAAHAPAHA